MLLFLLLMIGTSWGMDDDKLVQTLLESAVADSGTEAESDDPWDLNGPCQKAVEKLSIAQAEMVQCATNWSIPPTVCINCYLSYVKLKKAEYDTMHLNNIFSLDNRTCTDVIYGGYLLSYSRDISDALNEQIWEQSRCSSCINITFHFPDKPTYKMLDQTQIWEDKYLNFQQCVDNVTAYDEWAFRNGTTICQTCKDPLENLFNYFWKIYIDPDTDFCVDVETIMNDTMHLWNDVWKCADTKDRKKDRPLMIITLVVLIIFTLLFYSASYIQGGGRQRNFILYSGMPVVEERARLLSTSASGSDLASMNSGVYTVPIHRHR